MIFKAQIGEFSVGENILLKEKSQVMKFIKSFILLLLILPNSALAEEFQGKFLDWSIFKNNRGDQEICYMISTPIKRDKSLKQRGEAFLIVTNINNDADEVSVSSGIDYKENSDVEMSFGEKKYWLFPYLARAWANDKNEDIKIIKQMQKSYDLVVTAFSADDRVIHDTYSLLGFPQAYFEMKKICKQ